MIGTLEVEETCLELIRQSILRYITPPLTCPTAQQKIENKRKKHRTCKYFVITLYDLNGLFIISVNACKRGRSPCHFLLLHTLHPIQSAVPNDC